MTSYRRLISYIYAYEGETKGKNIGFAKLESRSGQCRLSVSVKKVYVGSSDLGVYLLAPEQELYLGNIFVRGGAGEFRAVVPLENVADSGCPMERCYGLVIHEKEDGWRSYKTIWEDAVTHAAELELPAAQTEERAESPEELHKKAEEVKRELEKEMKESEEAQTPIQPSVPPFIPPAGADLTAVQQPPNPRPSAVYSRTPAQFLFGPQMPKEAGRPSPAAANNAPAMQPDELSPGSADALARLDQEERTQGDPEELWESFRRRYPKIQAFDSSGGCEILTVKPQDIGLLPREVWPYGNNSFLLHGYYNYRHLIVARVGDRARGRVRYILGVPGHYYSNEKYMASMFGFPHFVLSKKQPSQDGRFGYWYVDIRLQNSD